MLHGNGPITDPLDKGASCGIADIAKAIGIDSAAVNQACFIAFTEGPCYSSDGSVYFTDLINDRILRFVLHGKTASAGGRFEVYRSPAGRPAGMVFDAEGRLIVCEGELGNSRQVTRTEHDGSITVIADSFEGKRLNTPNDVDVDSHGRIYFTDPRYLDPAGRELDHESVYRVDPDGHITRIIDDVNRPNGLAVSIEGDVLYVVESDNRPGGDRKLYAYTLLPDGSTGDRRVLHDFGNGRGGDGMCLDELGNLYVAAGQNAPSASEDVSVPAGVYVFTPEGELAGRIAVPMDHVTNVAFGDPDLRTLYVTCGHMLFHVRLKVRGHVQWPKPEE